MLIARHTEIAIGDPFGVLKNSGGDAPLDESIVPKANIAAGLFNAKSDGPSRAGHFPDKLLDLPEGYSYLFADDHSEIASLHMLVSQDNIRDGRLKLVTNVNGQWQLLTRTLQGEYAPLSYQVSDCLGVCMENITTVIEPNCLDEAHPDIHPLTTNPFSPVEPCGTHTIFTYLTDHELEPAVNESEQQALDELQGASMASRAICMAALQYGFGVILLDYRPGVRLVIAPTREDPDLQGYGHFIAISNSTGERFYFQQPSHGRGTGLSVLAEQSNYKRIVCYGLFVKEHLVGLSKRAPSAGSKRTSFACSSHNSVDWWTVETQIHLQLTNDLDARNRRSSGLIVTAVHAMWYLAMLLSHYCKKLAGFDDKPSFLNFDQTRENVQARSPDYEEWLFSKTEGRGFQTQLGPEDASVWNVDIRKATERSRMVLPLTIRHANRDQARSPGAHVCLIGQDSKEVRLLIVASIRQEDGFARVLSNGHTVRDYFLANEPGRPTYDEPFDHRNVHVTYFLTTAVYDDLELQSPSECARSDTTKSREVSLSTLRLKYKADAVELTTLHFNFVPSWRALNNKGWSRREDAESSIFHLAFQSVPPNRNFIFIPIHDLCTRQKDTFRRSMEIAFVYGINPVRWLRSGVERCTLNVINEAISVPYAQLTRCRWATELSDTPDDRGLSIAMCMANWREVNLFRSGLIKPEQIRWAPFAVVCAEFTKRPPNSTSDWRFPYLMPTKFERSASGVDSDKASEFRLTLNS